MAVVFMVEASATGKWLSHVPPKNGIIDPFIPKLKIILGSSRACQIFVYLLAF